MVNENRGLKFFHHSDTESPIQKKAKTHPTKLVLKDEHHFILKSDFEKMKKDQV
jgi:hypothetical protein